MSGETKENIARQVLIALHIYCLICCNYNAFKRFEYCERFSPNGWSLVWIIAQIVFWVVLCVINWWNIAYCVSNVKCVVIAFIVAALICSLVLFTVCDEFIFWLSIISIATQGVAIGIYCELEDAFVMHYH